MKNFLIVLTSIAALVATPILGQSIPRSYELQCAFGDGSRIAFKQHYTWNALAAMVPADVTTKEYTGYDVRFIDKKGKPTDWLKLRSMGSKFNHSYTVEDIDGAIAVCGLLSLPDGSICYQNNCIDSNGKWREAPNKPSALDWPREFTILQPTLLQPTLAHNKLEKRQLHPDTVRIRTTSGVIFYEQSLLDISHLGKRKDGNLTIVAVYQMQSRDGGKTWSDPIITTDAKIFELGKSPYAQSFAGFPYSYNGKLFNVPKPVK